MVLEYCPCGDLRRVLNKSKDNKLTESKARYYIAEIAFAINFLHENNILYRDLKPDNVLIAKDGHIKLTDFGMSKKIDEEYYNSYSFVGSTAYLAPEVIK